MNKAPILIVDDDEEDREFVKEAWSELTYQNPLLFFSTAESVLEYLHSDITPPLLILCDVNIPKMDGFALKAKLKESPSMKYKSIPFIFWSSQVSNAQIQKAYDLGVHGFFLKENRFDQLKASLALILNYWMKSVTPK